MAHGAHLAQLMHGVVGNGRCFLFRCPRRRRGVFDQLQRRAEPGGLGKHLRAHHPQLRNGGAVLGVDADQQAQVADGLGRLAERFIRARTPVQGFGVVPVHDEALRRIVHARLPAPFFERADGSVRVQVCVKLAGGRSIWCG